MATLICGSVAYDYIMTFEGLFRDNILPEQIHRLNVSFLVPTMRREFGGCAGNIAYSLNLLGGEPRIMATVGAIDAQPYFDRLTQLGLPSTYVRALPDTYTAQCMVTTDLEHNQIAAFHPGAMMQSQQNRVADAQGITLGIVAPDGADGMREHCEQFAQAGIPFVFDPGQGLPLFDSAALRRMIELARYVTVNDYEAKLLENKTGWTITDMLERVEAVIVTLGENGAEIHTHGSKEMIPAVPAERVVDPTGCGDAFRGGLLYGIEHGMDWATAGRLASLLGSLKIAHHGPQNYAVTRAEIEQKFEQAFGYRLK